MFWTPAHRRGLRRTSILVTAVAAVAVVGCASPSAKPAGTTPGDALPAGRPVGPTRTPAPAPTASANKPAGQAVADQPIIPQDAKYTIVCRGFTESAHVQQARVSKDNLIKATGRSDFYVVHDEAQSTLYFGYYREREQAMDPAEAARAKKDLEYIRSLADGNNQRLFGTSLIVPLPTPDPVAPAEFDIARLDEDKAPDDPSRRFWSIAIADYSNDVQIDGRSRKQIVVEAVQEARKRGIEAYYYNGPNTSTVCIGAWPRRAVREQEAAVAESGADNGQEIVVSNSPLSKHMMNEINQSGRDIKVVQPRVIVDDPTLLHVWQQYKEYSLNGNIRMIKTTDPSTGVETRKPQDSFLFMIPRQSKASTSLLAGEARENTPAGPYVPSANPLDPTAGKSSGIGALRPAGR